MLPAGDGMDANQDTRPIEEAARLRERLSEQEHEIRKLREENFFLGAVVDGIAEEIMVVDPDFIITDANRAFLERYGLTKDAILGRKCYDIKECAGAPCSLKAKACPLELAKQTGDTVEMTHQHGDLDGGTREFALTMYPFRSEDRDCRHYIELARDITDYRNLIKRLQGSEKKLRAILDTATNAILSIDENHEIILFNNAAERIFGYSRQEILGRNLNLLIPGQYGDHYPFVQRFLEKRESEIVGRTISLSALRKDGEEFPIELSLSFLELDDKVTFTAIIKDISDQRRLERKLLQSERLAAVGQAAAHVAHELKNPLMIIGGFSSQIRGSLLDDKDARKLDLILDEVRRLEKLVGHLGDFTKTYRLVKRQSDINMVLKDVVRIMAGAYPKDKYRFKESLAADVGEIHCDPDKLKQVFINVISNGLEAMTSGGTITVSSKRSPDGIEIRVSDEGSGIPASELQQIFEPFYTTREQGSGLGLSISYKIIAAHSGDISAVSQPGRGTAFIIKLPET
jgi:two-component system sensor kinase FixL